MDNETHSSTVGSMMGARSAKATLVVLCLLLVGGCSAKNARNSSSPKKTASPTSLSPDPTAVSRSGSTASVSPEKGRDTSRPTPGPPDVVGESEDNNAAGSLNAKPTCRDGHTPGAEVSWTPARTPGSLQLVEFTQFEDGFQSERFEKSESLGAGTTHYEIKVVEPGIYYRVRVNTRHATKWTPSATLGFYAQGCAMAGAPG